MKKVVLFAPVVFLAACAPATTVKTYVDSTLTKATVTSGGITVLPLLLSTSVKDANVPELRRELAKRTGDSVQKYFPQTKIVGYEETLSALESENLMDGFTSTANTFDTTGILKSDTLVKLLAKTNTRYAILPYLQSASTLITGAGIYTSRSFNASFSMVIWDSVKGSVVYEGSGKASQIASMFKNNNILDTTYEAFDNAGKKLMSDLK
ncbi:hypothetical protein [Deinococcus aerophilus]|uniref:Lipoprotein n=1 Tax=Deinococcus aerophilus TaxID=522488 RepID=A0ABQ2H063_9DEIO|nr:hypothetical protein [Deinococcus aerophilus]GGM22621.1 hypothetical protein GCM10010841_33090 [Deinococcus aerophilus]